MEKKAKKLTDCMFFTQSRRIDETFFSRNPQYITVLGKDDDEKIIRVYGYYNQETKQLLDYVNHGSLKDPEGLFEIHSLLGVSEIPENAVQCYFRLASYEEQGKKDRCFIDWPEVLEFKFNNSNAEESLTIFAMDYGKTPEMREFKVRLEEITENGFKIGNIFYEIS